MGLAGGKKPDSCGPDSRILLLRWDVLMVDSDYGQVGWGVSSIRRGLQDLVHLDLELVELGSAEVLLLVQQRPVGETTGNDPR